MRRLAPRYLRTFQKKTYASYLPCDLSYLILDPLRCPSLMHLTQIHTLARECVFPETIGKMYLSR